MVSNKSDNMARFVRSISLLMILNCCSLLSAVQIDILMPNVSPKVKDTYLCNQVKLDDNKPFYITEFQPKSTKQIAHHILLFGCGAKADEDLWNCGEMSSSGKQDEQYKHGPVCKGGKQTIIYAWAMDAPKLTLPKDVAFKVGGNTDIKYLVLQVHYSNVDQFQSSFFYYFTFIPK
jgi:peptidylglycine monooxygenase